MAVRHFLCHSMLYFPPTIRLFRRTASVRFFTHTHILYFVLVLSSLWYVFCSTFFSSFAVLDFYFWFNFDLAFPNVCICWAFFLVCICLCFTWMVCDPMFQCCRVGFFCLYFFCKLNKIFVLQKKRTERNWVVSSVRVHHWKM